MGYGQHVTESLTLLPDRLVDTVKGRVRKRRAVVIEGSRIAAVINASDISPDIRVIDLSGYTLLPGLIDAHCHLVGDVDGGQGYGHLVTRSAAQEVLLGVKNAGEMLRAGFTTVRDVGTFRAFADVALHDAIENGWVAGPRMQCAGAYVTCSGGGGDITGLAIDVDHNVPFELRYGVVSGVDQMRAKVRQILGRGADFIKVIATGAVLTRGTEPGASEFTEEEIRAAVEVAEGAGTYVAAHAHGAEGIKRAVRAGVRSIEHGSLMDAEAIALMAEFGTYLVADLYDGDWIAEQGPARGYVPEVLEKNDLTAEAQRDGFEKCIEAGVKVAFGADSGVFPHRYTGRQFAYYVKHGLSPIKAIQSATRWAAELMGWEDRVGAIAPGMHADFIAVEGDPTKDVSLLENIGWVMKGGQVVERPEKFDR
jgi:imidazolonepropionase-like amidohydrolase